MRRKEREVTDPKALEEILKQCKICRIAMRDEKGLYIVPLSFGYAYEGGKLTLYFHSAKEGRKVSAFQASPDVAFEMDCGMELIAGETACHYTCAYQSVIGSGLVSQVEGHDEKAKALDALMFHQTGRHFDFNEKMTGYAAVYKLEASAFSGKQNLMA